MATVVVQKGPCSHLVCKGAIQDDRAAMMGSRHSGLYVRSGSLDVPLAGVCNAAAKRAIEGAVAFVVGVGTRVRVGGVARGT